MFMRCLVGGFLLLGASLANAAPPLVDLELITQPGLAIDAPQKWLEMMKDVKLSSVRIRGGERGDVGRVEQIGSEERPHYRVSGIITSGNVLRLPGASIRLNDKTSLNNYLAKLQDGGEDGVLAKKVMYGLTAQQMLAVHESLKGKLDFSTKGEATGEVVQRIAKSLDLEVALAASGAAAESSAEPVADEFEGLAYGTALAGVLRPLGLVFVPEKKLGSKVRLLVSDSDAVEKPWPVGWETEATPSKLAPDYFVKTNAKVTDYVLADALAKIQERIKLPMVFDYNSIARHRIDLQVKVNSKEGRKSYASVIDEILYQGRLKAELRIDEAEQPFLWISTLKK